jgi:small-conductance mechanosensitive channel
MLALINKWLAIEVISAGDYKLSLLQLISFFIFLALTALAARIIPRALNRLALRDGVISSAQIYVLGRFIHYIILFGGFLIAISMLGIDMGKLALIISALGVGIGLGLQGVVNNFVSGLVILLEKTLKVGDFIELASGLVGEVVQINMRATLIRSNDNVDVLIPNSELVNGLVTNWTLEEAVRRFRIPFSVAYGSDKILVRKAALEAAKSLSYTLHSEGREPIVWMTGFGDSALHFVLGVWVAPEQVKRPTTLMSDFLWALDDSFREYAIEVPFPQRDIHLRSQGASGKDLDAV